MTGAFTSRHGPGEGSLARQGGNRWADITKKPLTWLATLATLSPWERAQILTSDPCLQRAIWVKANWAKEVSVETPAAAAQGETTSVGTASALTSSLLPAIYLCGALMIGRPSGAEKDISLDHIRS